MIIVLCYDTMRKANMLCHFLLFLLVSNGTYNIVVKIWWEERCFYREYVKNNPF